MGRIRLAWVAVAVMGCEGNQLWAGACLGAVAVLGWVGYRAIEHFWGDVAYRRRRAQAQAPEVERIVNDALATNGASLGHVADLSLLSRCNLQKSESVFWVMRASLAQMKTRTTAVRYAGVGARIRIAKGVYWRAGTMAVERVRQDVLEHRSGGILVITSKRVLFIADNPSVSNWSKTWGAIAGWSVFIDALLVEPASGKPVYFMPEFTGARNDPRVAGVAMSLATGRT